MLQTFSTTEWDSAFSSEDQKHAVERLESGHILFFPELPFSLSPEEKCFLSPDYADPHAKNISYHAKQNKLWGVQSLTDQQHLQLKAMLDRFSRYAAQLVHSALPHYKEHLTLARTSFRPVQVCDRKTSYRKDDKRLHVDAFPSAPNQGKRILRVFSNINPNNEPRIWRTGEPFEQVAGRFIPQIARPLPGTASILRMLHITKSHRTLYDHYMLQMHNRMKADEAYQQRVVQQEIQFPAGSSWIVQTDHVSHAAMKGQYLLEQTFYLPIEAMQQQALSPLRVLEKMLNKKLV